MLKRFVAPTVVLAGLLLAPLAGSLAARPQEQRRPDESRPALENRLANRRDGWGQPVKPPVKGQKSDPAPKRDLSGIWGPGDGGIHLRRRDNGAGGKTTDRPCRAAPQRRPARRGAIPSRGP